MIQDDTPLEYAIQTRYPIDKPVDGVKKWTRWHTNTHNASLEHLLTVVERYNSWDYLRGEQRVVCRPRMEWQVVEGSEMTEEQRAARRKYAEGL